MNSALKPMVRGRKRKRRGSRLVKAAIRVAAVLSAAGLVWCAYMLWLIESYRLPKPVPDADAAIVLGAALWNDAPSPGLRERLDRATELYKQGKVRYLLVTGGYDNNGSKLSEGEGMRRYLLQHGIPDSRIVVENKSRSTYENLKFSKPLVQKHGWRSLLIVTHDFHAARAGEIARELRYPSPLTVLGYPTHVLSIAYHHSREVLAFTKWKLDVVQLRLRLRPGSITY